MHAETSPGDDAAGLLRSPEPYSEKTAADYHGQTCEACNAGRYIVRKTQIVGGSRIRFLYCQLCWHRPPQNKLLIPLEFAPRRVHQ